MIVEILLILTSRDFQNFLRADNINIFQQHNAVFGEIFKIDYPAWDEDIAAGRCFRTIPVDEYGYPKNGHIICADSDWWVDRFDRAGFKREIEIERALHRKRDEAMEKISSARRSSYIFSKNASFESRRAILDRIFPA